MAISLSKRRLGTLGPVVSEIGLGCVGMSDLYGVPDRAESLATIRHAVERGVTLIDTSDVYGGGDNELLLAEALGSSRDEVVLSTKFGAIRSTGGAGYTTNGRPEHVVAACEASLHRLGTDRIDLYYQHRMDPAVPIEETVGAMAALVAQGKVSYLGLSECSSATLRRAHAVHTISAVQIEYSLLARDPEDDLLPTCRQLGVGLVAYSPLGRGMLTGTITSVGQLEMNDYRRVDPRYGEDNLPHNLTMVGRLCELAVSRGCSPGQLALAWLLAAGRDIVPIPGTKRRHYLEDNLAAVDLHLSPAELDQISSVVDAARVAGARYPPAELPRLGI